MKIFMNPLRDCVSCLAGTKTRGTLEETLCKVKCPVPKHGASWQVLQFEKQVAYQAEWYQQKPQASEGSDQPKGNRHGQCKPGMLTTSL